MDRETLNYIIDDMPKNSVKRACYVVREYLRYSNEIKIDQEEVLQCEEGCAVTLKEYLEASKILLAYSFENSKKETNIELFNCENDCSHNNGCTGFCMGEFSVSKEKNLNLCKYYSDSKYI
jgi:hypothetical protein